MEYETLSKKELVSRLKRLESEKIQVWDNIKTLITKISHEMKTPLNSIIGFSELFRYRSADTKLVGYIDNIMSASEYMLSLVENLIDITTAQHKPIELVYSIFNVKDTVSEVVNNFPNSKINVTLADINICADYTRFKQVIYNLISNAIKYTGADNPINIITYVESGQFCFEIKDNGDGIAEEDKERIFQLFTQVSDDTAKRQSGSGIGLALCKTIAEAHKGTIMVDSVKGEGSTFIFTIPIERSLV